MGLALRCFRSIFLLDTAILSGCNVFPHYGKHPHGICFWNDIAQSWVIKTPLISQSTRLKTNKICKQFCTPGCFMSWASVCSGLMLKKFISSPGKGSAPTGSFTPQGTIGMVTMIQLSTTFFLMLLQASVIHCTVPSPCNTSLIFRNVYKCQQAGRGLEESVGSREVWSLMP